MNATSAPTNFFMSLIMMTLGIYGVSTALELTPGETTATYLTTTFLFCWAWFGKMWRWIWIAAAIGWFAI